MRYEFGGLIFGGAYTWRGLFSEFYGIYVYSTRHNVTKIAIESRLSLKQAQCATTTNSQKEIQYIEKVREKYTEENQMVKCVYSINLRIQLSLLPSRAARNDLRDRRCKTSLPAREG